MMPAKPSLLESHLRQKIIQFEHSLAKIADTKKKLRYNEDLVKGEIRAAFGSYLTQLLRREQELMESLENIVSAKHSVLSEQQAQLHQALGACTQGLERYETAMNDVKNGGGLANVASVEERMKDVLEKLSIIEIEPRENPGLSFVADTMSIRKSLSSFGHIRTAKTTSKKSVESLPAQWEDYEDEDVVHSLLHKAVDRGKNPTIFIGRPVLSNDPKDWLLREALTGRHAAIDHDLHDQSITYKHCVTNGGPDKRGNIQRQAQVHSWLHHIKDQVEHEPNIFEDFEVLKQEEIKPCDAIKAELSGAVVDLFRRYFQKVLMSPANQWLLQSMEGTDLAANPNSGSDGDLEIAQDFAMEDMEVMESPTPMTYASSEDGHSATANKRLLDSNYAQIFQEFLHALWSSTDSLWIPACTSEKEPQPLANDAGGTNGNRDQTPMEEQQIPVTQVIDRTITGRMENVSLHGSPLDTEFQGISICGNGTTRNSPRTLPPGIGWWLLPPGHRKSHISGRKQSLGDE